MTIQDRYHFSLIRRALDEIDAADSPLSLEDLAGKMQMSSAHFQRIFSRWVGVSPKRYQQYLQLGHAKTLLRDRFSVLDTAHATGLSGSGRLHDMFIQWEAMSPGVYAAKGEGLTIYQGWFDGPFGEMLAMGTDRGLCGLAFTSECGREVALNDMKSRWPKARFIEEENRIKAWIDGAIGGTETSVVLIGAPIQIKVWEALLQIPSGHVTSYSEIASAIGAPRAQRAVGTAVGRNPVSWLIPCHRALRKSGDVGGYHWGVPVKRALLAWEGARADDRDDVA